MVQPSVHNTRGMISVEFEPEEWDCLDLPLDFLRDPALDFLSENGDLHDYTTETRGG
jgi:hypothetical protein